MARRAISLMGTRAISSFPGTGWWTIAGPSPISGPAPRPSQTSQPLTSPGPAEGENGLRGDPTVGVID